MGRGVATGSAYPWAVREARPGRLGEATRMIEPDGPVATALPLA